MTTLIIIDKPPYGSWSGREALDMAFALAAFDQPVSLLFTDAGVNWLRKEQNPAAVQQKSAERNLTAAPVFGVEALFVEAGACHQYSLDESQLLDGVQQVEVGDEWLSRYDHVTFAN